MLTVGIAGGTGSGKTTVVRKLIEMLPRDEVVILPQDSYYKDNSHIPIEERQKINFDHPEFGRMAAADGSPGRAEGRTTNKNAGIFIPYLHQVRRDHPG